MTLVLQLAFWLLCLVANVFSLDEYDLVFASDPLMPRALLSYPDHQPFSQMPKNAFTFCVYIYLENAPGQSVTLFSYSSKESYEPNEIYFETNYYTEPYSALSIHGSAVTVPQVPKLKEWNHICAAWNSTSGDILLFMNGTEILKKEAVKKDYEIGGNGFLVLGQDQDYYDGRYDASQGVKGRMTQFNLWAHELSVMEVNEVMNCSLSGDVVAWSNSSWQLSDGIMVESTKAPCSIKSCGNVKSGSSLAKKKSLAVRIKDEECKDDADCPVKPCLKIGKLRECSGDNHTCTCKDCTKSSQCDDCPDEMKKKCSSGTCICAECISYFDCPLKPCSDIGKLRYCIYGYRCACRDCTTDSQCEDCPAGKKKKCLSGTCSCTECSSYKDCPINECNNVGKLSSCSSSNYTCTCKDCVRASQCGNCSDKRKRKCLAGSCTCSDA